MNPQIKLLDVVAVLKDLPELELYRGQVGTIVEVYEPGAFKRMNITFKAEEERLIQEKIKSGKYSSAYEVIVEALRLLEERDNQYQKWLEETREKVTVGIAQLDRGEGIDGDVVMARLREKLKKAAENQG